MRIKRKSNSRINDKDYCLKFYNFAFNQAKLELPMSKILDGSDIFDDDVYQDIWRDLFTKKLYEILDRNIEALEMVPTCGEPSWLDWIDKAQREKYEEGGDTINYFGRLFSLAMGSI